VTGGAGFIGSNFVQWLLAHPQAPEDLKVVVVDLPGRLGVGGQRPVLAGRLGRTADGGPLDISALVDNRGGIASRPSANENISGDSTIWRGDAFGPTDIAPGGSLP